MRFSGRVFKDDDYWLAEIPILDIMTQGHTENESYTMVIDAIESLINKKDFKVEIYKGIKGNFEITSPDSKSLISLLLKRKRESSGLSLAQVAARLGVTSRNSYARYEKGETMPTLGKLNELLRAVEPSLDFVINDSSALTKVPLTNHLS